MTLRPLLPSDVARVMAISRASFGSSTWQASDFQSHPARRIWVVSVAAEAVAGFAVMQIIGDEAEIQSLAVDLNWRRQGIAHRLVEHALAEARQAGAQAVYLEVREQNAAAQSLYRRFGFAAVGRRPHYYRDPEDAALLLRLDFDPPIAGAIAPRL